MLFAPGLSLLLLWALASSAPGAGLELGSTIGLQRVSRSASGNSLAPTLSASGRFVGFLSHANNLVTNDDLGLSFDVFVQDLKLGQTVLASVSPSGVGGGAGESASVVLSSNGLWVAFESLAGNLVAGDTNGQSDVFVRDLSLGVTRRQRLVGQPTDVGRRPLDRVREHGDEPAGAAYPRRPARAGA
jgi:Tol biopolymer transport system component